MELLPAYQAMIKVHGWQATAATFGLTKTALEQRVYETKGSGMRVDLALMIQDYAGTKHFAQAVAHASGGVFYALPEPGDLSDVELHDKFHELYEELGELSREYTSAKKDGRIDARERAALQILENRMHTTIRELMTLMFLINCPLPNPAAASREAA